MQPKLLTADDLFPDQQRAVETAMEFLNDDSATEMLVEGAAGTGKTSAVRVLINEMDRDQRSETVVCAPTNKAVKVARELSGDTVETTTIYKLLSLRPQPNGEIKEIKQGEEAYKKLMATRNVVLDEGSMASSALRPFILDAIQNYGIRFIYLADRYQLNPVGEDISWVFREVRNRVVLDKVKRHDNAILNLATHLRGVIDSGNPSNLKISDDFTEADGGIEVFRRAKAFDEKILDTWAALNDANDRDFSGHRMIAWTNNRVNGFNEMVREAIYDRRTARDNRLLLGERIVVCNPVLSLRTGEVLMHTDEEGFIEQITTGPHPDYEEIECFKMAIRRESNNEVVGVFSPTEDGWLKANRQMDNLRKKALNEDKMFWGPYYAMQEKINDVRPCHALTTHRSQGSTFLRTFVDLDNILGNDNKMEALKSAYVAVTRAQRDVNLKWSGR